MTERALRRGGSRWFAYGAAVLLLYTFYVLWQVNFYLAQSLAARWVPAAAVALTTLYFSRRGLSDGAEMKLYAAYCLWFTISRMLCGDVALLVESPLVVAQLVCLLMLSVGLVQDRAGRDRLLLWMAVLLSLYISAVSCLSLYVAVRGVPLYSPITEGMVALLVYDRLGYVRLCVMDQSSNIAGLWFYLGLWMTVWLFARCSGRARFWRVLLLPAGLAEFAALSLTQSRNVKLALAVSAALLAMLLVRRVMRVQKRGVTALILALAALCAAPSAYACSGAAARAVGLVSAAVTVDESAEEPATPAEPETGAEEKAPTDEYTDQRKLLDDNGRFLIYRSALETLRREPIRLLRGCLSTKMTAVLNEMDTSIPYAHFHNLCLEVLLLTGVVGFCLVMAFCVLLLIRCARLFFSPRAPMTLKLLILPIVGSLQYNMLEVNLFKAADLRSVSFFLLAGFLLGGYYELYPTKKQAERPV